MSINKVVCYIIFKIKNEAYNEKRAVATTCISISGKYSVVVFDNSGIGVSKKITDANRRECLRKLAEPFNIDGYSVILRTNCENTSDSDIEKEISTNLEKLKDIRKINEFKGKNIKFSIVKKSSTIYKDELPEINLPKPYKNILELLNIKWEYKGGKLSFKPDISDFS